jgi:hypothetical protein
MVCLPLQWMVPTIQNSMKPFKVSSGSPVAGVAGVGMLQLAEQLSCFCRIWTTHASLNAS